MNKLSNKKGLTLIEVIVTLAVLGIVVTPLMTMFITSQKVNAESKKEYDSIQLAQKYMEEIKSMASSGFDKDKLHLYYDSVSGDIFTGRASESGYDITITIESEEPIIATGSAAVEYDEIKDINSNIAISVGSDDKITFSDYTESTFVKKNIKLNIKKDVGITVRNYKTGSGNTLNIYIFADKDPDEKFYKATVKVDEGSVKVIKNESSGPKPDNLVYGIKIAVEKDGQTVNVEGTAVFKYKPF